MTCILTIPNIHPSTHNHEFHFPLTQTSSSQAVNYFTLSKRTDYFQMIDKLTEFNQENPTLTQKLYESDFLDWQNLPSNREVKPKSALGGGANMLYDEIL